MRRNLQSKFNLLGVTLIAFSLLMIPMFNQVKADTRDSLKDAKNTWMSKMFREISRDFKPNLENTEVEDYWAEQVKQHNEDCRNDPNNAMCDANGDLDGDGVSNGDEVRQGRHPACNEDKLGDDYCRDRADKYNLTEPDPVQPRIQRTMVLNKTWNLSECGTEPIVTNRNCPAAPFSRLLVGNITLIEAYLNVTNYSGTGFTWRIEGPNSQSTISRNAGGFEPTPRQLPMQYAQLENPSPGSYQGRISFSNSQSGQTGSWQLTVWASVAS